MGKEKRQAIYRIRCMTAHQKKKRKQIRFLYKQVMAALDMAQNVCINRIRVKTTASSAGKGAVFKI